MTSHRVYSPDEIVARLRSDGRLDQNIDRSAGPDACWPWRGTLTSKGYGRLRVGARTYLAHRLSYAFYAAAPGMLADRDAMVLHSCDNPPCCNPNHLRIGDNADNMRDAHERGRLTLPVGRKFKTGERRGAKLEASDVVALRLNAEGLSQRAWARRLGVSQTQVSRAVHGVTFPEVGTLPRLPRRSTPC